MGVSYAFAAEQSHQLMGLLGHTRFGAVGGDFGSAVAARMALQATERLLGCALAGGAIDAEHVGRRILSKSHYITSDEHADGIKHVHSTGRLLLPLDAAQGPASR